MKAKALIFCLLLILSACKGKSEKENTSEDYPSSKDTTSKSAENMPTSQQNENSTQNVVENDINDEETENAQSPTSNENSNSYILSGNFIKTDHLEDAGCNCYCVEIGTNKGSELCLVENEMYINTRFSKSGNRINIFYTGKSAKNTNNELPWDEFDKNQAIAVITPQSNGNFKLDWKGFSINGDLAVDYALFGKKTLEGTYKKQ